MAHDTFWHGLRDRRAAGSRAWTEPTSPRFTFNRRAAYVLKHPDHVDHVLYDGVEHYHKSIEYEMLRAALGLSLFTDEDESWRRHRMLINPVLAKRHLASLFELMVDPIETFLARLRVRRPDRAASSTCPRR